ncbi:D-alanine--D-alanine ligase [Alicyclobacillus fastidiosus]|uniref:D-alanine--D-alanine ligase n=1 Tax=Alicyclobacillus fastidiosus TaxID=392011 RepID=A0ABY6Z9Y7_9BACL|nr:D-alanine--D-alanine ligase [Alicyclobacillus fastidiosus]WAH39694.1 D-alanine--D-alanine ligase [Alicyclobacillus fastidiosus]GMA60910.1 D-alanine--D-alanine ligase [Alicyclobacillus fastidiosus]
MPLNRIKVGVVFGGKSGEHEVSLQSAKSVIEALDPHQYTIVPIGISKSGRWHVGKNAVKSLEEEQKATKKVTSGPSASFINEQVGGLTSVSAQSAPEPLPPTLAGDVDVIIPVMHGTYGEDGSIQGLLELMDVAYVGAGILASAVGLDKIVMKQVFGSVGLPQVRYVGCTRKTWKTRPHEIIDEIERTFGYPCFVKPANLGSSVGITKAKSRTELERAMELAAQYDRKIIVEEGLDVREVEVAVLGNDTPQVSVAGEIVPSNEFYDYKAKYVGGTSKLIIPAELTDEQRNAIATYATQAFQAIDCSGLARVDFFIEKSSGKVIINEINTMPGFTRYSMYPKLWEASGMSYSKLLDTLIQLALERNNEKRELTRSFDAE